MLKNSKIILFDGVCNLCNGAVTFVIKRDKQKVFKFATLQSELGVDLLSNFKIDRSELDSIILINGDRFYSKSSAALYIAKNLSGAYPLLFGFIILPKFLRDWIYDFIAKNRYRWFGKRESCMIPTPELAKRFL
ncbi:MAG TPA: thiol-disulfide oxidoreductase DCC family protein [Aequorivita sp.]|nr:thiol-disulfide oxidoreductase DCC family protein [Aequorivita sp.]